MARTLPIYAAPARMKLDARAAVTKAIADGLIPNDEGCAACGVPQHKVDGRRQVERHHPDYRYPLWTVPLCCRCHRGVHGGRIADPGFTAANGQLAFWPAERAA